MLKKTLISFAILLTPTIVTTTLTVIFLLLNPLSSYLELFILVIFFISTIFALFYTYALDVWLFVLSILVQIIAVSLAFLIWALSFEDIVYFFTKEGPYVEYEISHEYNTFSSQYKDQSFARPYHFNKAKTQVYGIYPNHDGPLTPLYIVRQVKDADPNTFRHVSDFLGVDKNNVYLRSNIIPDLSPKNFKRISYDFIIGKSKSTGEDLVYFGREPLKNVDAQSFELKIGYATDKNNVYSGAETIADLSPKGLTHVGSYLLGKSKSGENGLVFYASYDWSPLNNADTQSFKLKSIWGNDNLDYAVDRNNVYYRDEVVSTRAATFRRLNEDYYQHYELIKSENLKKEIRQDSNGYFTDDHFIYSLNPNEDGYHRFDLEVKTTELLIEAKQEYAFSRMYLKDKNTVYFQPKYHNSPTKLEQADADSFQFICPTYKKFSYDRGERLVLIGMDKNHVYRDNEIIEGITPKTFDHDTWCAEYVGEFRHN